jgi:hypothetical protein
VATCWAVRSSSTTEQSSLITQGAISGNVVHHRGFPWLGADAVERIEVKLSSVAANLDQVRQQALSTNFAD